LRAVQRLAELDEIEVAVEKLVAGGDDLARFEGIPIFVARAAPGDKLRVRVVERRPDYGRAEITEVLQPGPARRPPPCPHFGNCGGCDLQHLQDEAQVELKAAAVREALERLGGIDKGQAIEVLAGQPWGYRLRTQLHVAETDGATAVGYFARRSSRVVAVDCCPVLVAELETWLQALPGYLTPPPVHRLDLTLGEDGALTTAPMVAGLPHGEVKLVVGEFEYLLDARCFFQAHRQLLSTLVERVVGEAGGDEAFDLYAGVGLFSLPLARKYRRVVAVESDRVAARYARRNAKRHRFARVEVIPQAVETWIRELPENAARVVVDPPRSGLSRRTRAALLQSAPRRLTYVSCHAAALARDLKELRGRYRIEQVTFLDMFPQTGHMEVVVQLLLRQ
jgi:23S rRNA (uracil1939-C5)-methyltransferase